MTTHVAGAKPGAAAAKKRKRKRAAEAAATIAPVEVDAIHEERDLEPVYVWDLVVRATHWLIALSMVVLAVTGVYIGRPFLIADGEAGQQFVMGTMKVVHYYGAIVFSLAVLARLIWMFTGSRYARWRQFIPISAARRRKLVGTFLFYIMVRDKPPEVTGHNPLAGLTYVAVFGLYILIILTGFALYSVSAYTSYMQSWDFLLPIFGGAQGARWLHHVTMWLLIGFVVHHFFSALLVSRVEKNGTIDSIFSGWKYLPKDREDDDA